MEPCTCFPDAARSARQQTPSNHYFVQASAKAPDVRMSRGLADVKALNIQRHWDINVHVALNIPRHWDAKLNELPKEILMLLPLPLLLLLLLSVLMLLLLLLLLYVLTTQL